MAVPSLDKIIKDTRDQFKPMKYACTVVSLLPYAIRETKPHMIPFTFDIPAADPKIGFSILHVEEGLHFVPNPFEETHNFRVTTSPNEMARSIVEDYCGAHIGLDEDAGPGMFYVEGRLSVEDVLRHCGTELKRATERQNRWFSNLINIADADWHKNKNILAVSDLQRHAARSLNVKREWVDPIPTEFNTCPYCKAVVDPTSIKCQNCKEIINPEAYKALQAKLGLEEKKG
jgi:hypothetical protein